jgi:Predicted permease, DMT superfamily
MVVNRGVVYTITSALIFGFTPILTRIAYDGGANGVTMTFLRASLCLPLLFAVLAYSNISVRVTRRELWSLFLACGMGGALTTITLYASYAYIPVGMATTLHFVYPILVSLGCVAFYRDRMTSVTVAALVAGTVGVVLSADGLAAGNGSAFGVALALFSGLTFAYYAIAVEKSGLFRMHYLKLTFWFCVFSALFSGGYGLASGSLTLSLTPRAWCYAWIVSFFASIFGITLLQIGIKRVGATAASILSTFEPITSVVLGVLILGERMSPAKLAGCACILVGVVLIAWKTSNHGERRC